MLEARSERTNSPMKRITLGADKKYDYREFVDAARAKHETMQVAQREDRRLMRGPTGIPDILWVKGNEREIKK